MTLDPVLLLNALASGLLLGGFYALAASGLAVAFGLLDVVNIAHPAIMVAAAFAVSALSEATALDPALTTLIVAAPLALAGAALYRAYHFFFGAARRRIDCRTYFVARPHCGVTIDRPDERLRASHTVRRFAVQEKCSMGTTAVSQRTVEAGTVRLRQERSSSICGARVVTSALRFQTTPA
jgi:hypothetical protein